MRTLSCFKVCHYDLNDCNPNHQKTIHQLGKGRGANHSGSDYCSQPKKQVPYILVGHLQISTLKALWQTPTGLSVARKYSFLDCWWNFRVFLRKQMKRPIRETESEPILARGLVVFFIWWGTRWSLGLDCCGIGIQNRCPAIHPSDQWNEQVDCHL